MIVLDSDVVIDIQRGIPPAVIWFNGLPQSETVIIPGYVAMEVICGTRDDADQRKTERWLSSCRIVWLEPDLCQQAYKTLLSVHLQNAIDEFDVLIAQVAISLQQPLYTFNQKHFDAIAGLKTLRPYTR